MPVQDASGISEPKSEIGLILVIEDDPRMQKVLKRIFAGENYAVEIAGDGKTGMELFLSHRPMAVLLDLILPQVSGRELCQEIKSISPETPVIVLSAIS
jgi:DNA-binding response OmpR family regulator